MSALFGRADVKGILRLTRSPTSLASEIGRSGDGMWFSGVYTGGVYGIN